MLARSTKECRKRNPYSLRVQVCRLTFSVDEVSINPCLINSVELSLVYEEVGLAQRPSLCYRQTIQLVADFQQSIVLILKPLINLALSVFELVSVRTSRWQPRTYRSSTISVQRQHLCIKDLRSSCPARIFPSSSTKLPSFVVFSIFLSCSRRAFTSEAEN